MINWGYFQPNLLIYSKDISLYMIFRVKSSRPKFPEELVYEEETVEFQHPSCLKSKQHIGTWVEHASKLFWNQTISYEIVHFIHIGISFTSSWLWPVWFKKVPCQPLPQTSASTGNPRCTQIYQLDTLPFNKVFLVFVCPCSLNPNRKIILQLHLSL